MTLANPDSDQRLEQLKSWLLSIACEFQRIEAASEDASFRRYFRVYQNDGSLIAMDSPPAHNDNQPFIQLSRLLEETGINVPHIQHFDLDQGFILMRDLGSTHYLDALSPDNAVTLYQQAIDSILKMQSATDLQNIPLYDQEALLSEMLLFDTWYIQKHQQLTLTRRQQQILSETYRLCIDSARQQPQRLVHRDFHSRNLMLTPVDNPGVIDFQDAVVGPISYDLVSLLKDCYIEWPESLQSSLLQHYRAQAKTIGICNCSESELQYWFDLMGLQRHIKVMGIFCRLNYRDNKPRYMYDLPLVFKYIDKVTRRYPALSGFRELLHEIGAYEEFA